MKIAIVNDSVLAVEVIRRIVNTDGRHHVIWTARDGREAAGPADAAQGEVLGGGHAHFVSAPAGRRQPQRRARRGAQQVTELNPTVEHTSPRSRWYLAGIFMEIRSRTWCSAGDSASQFLQSAHC